MVDINDGQLGTIMPDEISSFSAWSSCDHEGASAEIDTIVRELVESDKLTIERAQQLSERAIEMSYDACCVETQLLAVGVAAGARVLVHRKAGELQLSGLWLARMQNSQKIMQGLLEDLPT